ncbi:putative gag-pol polyprotein [Panicum miliaceum]|uniref:RNA-directed DNA polymerase n=1 Tax=Panicum miliaceum TaxID=4540 RepID=A0A3L6PZX2_PANMI|nr:putative gag-pol polyprotein [Panicum miliaceum]
MDPNLKTILDEIKGMRSSVEDFQTSLTQRIDGVETNLGDRFQAMEDVARVFESWKPKMDSSMEDLRTEVSTLRKTVNRVVLDSHPASSAGIFPKPQSAAASPSAGNPVDGPHGHRNDSSHRENVFGHVYTQSHSPVKGTSPERPNPHLVFPAVNSSHGPSPVVSGRSTGTGRLPKLHFPLFEGDNPRLWISRYEDYFEMYQVESDMWIKVASMHFATGPDRWLQSVEKRLKMVSWSEFCQMILDRFGKNHHELLIRQLFHINQLSSVAEYRERFSELVDQLTAYETHTDPPYYTMRFVDGPRGDIQSVVLIQRPSDLDTACVLALLQEEVSEGDKKKEFRRPDYFGSSRTVSRGPLTLPLPPKPEKPTSGSHVEDKRVSESWKPRQVDDKLAALCAYRRAKGQCVKCAERWHRDHKCPQTVQLHVMQELLDLFQVEAQDSGDCSDAGEVEEPECLALSVAVVSGVQGPRTMKLAGFLQGKEVLVLVDSGSSHTFVSSTLAASLSGVVDLPKGVGVQVADGGRLLCTAHIPSVEWSVQSCSFTTDMKILPLSHYDIIVGMDWLEANSPMKIHWKLKWMVVPYLGSHTLLQGLPEIPEEALVEVSAMLVSEKSVLSLDVPAELAAILAEFSDVFDAPSGLPPERSCDHSIPLVAGASPVAVRPYRYPPAVKDEIEKQIISMLKEGIIQHSVSPFSSSVLLVKKKDKSWRFCVDFRHLNAITLKCKYPVPLIDDFLDELGKASWFASLDLTAGYHQIRLKPGEAHKTAFQTHTGHYEFRVMAFGLSGAPATFQKAMNTTLAPALRKFALVFFDDILIYSQSYEEHLEHIKQVLQLLAKDQWKVKLSKCSFAQGQVSYLGHVISQEGVSTDPSKVKAVLEWPIPKCVKELRGFLGFAGYYRKFVKHFGIIAKPLTELLKKGAIFIWTHDHQVAFQALSPAPVLALPDFVVPFCVETDASGSGIGAILMQKGHPLAYLSKPLGPKSRGLSTYEKEYMAILAAIDQWRHYLQFGEFHIFTDEKNLVQLSEQRLHTPWQQKVFTKLLGLDYKIIYKKGEDNRAADALSRRLPVEPECAVISSATPQWLDQVAASYNGDTFAKDMVAKLAINAEAIPFYTFRNGLLRFKGRIWIGNDPALQN